MFLSLLHVNLGGDPEHPHPGRDWLRNIYRVHQRLWMAFPDAERRAKDEFFLDTWNGPPVPDPKPGRAEAGFLFRIEPDCPNILVQSVEPPHWAWAFQNAPYLLTCDPRVREFDPWPQRDQSYRFRLLVNVVRRRSLVHADGTKRRTRPELLRKRRAEVLIHPDPLPKQLPSDPVERKQLLAARWDPWRTWLAEIGKARGFRVLDDHEGPLTMEAIHMSVSRRERGRADPKVKRIDRRYNAGLFEGLLVCTDPDPLRNAVINGIGNGKAFGLGLLSLRVR